MKKKKNKKCKKLDSGNLPYKNIENFGNDSEIYEIPTYTYNDEEGAFKRR